MTRRLMPMLLIALLSIGALAGCAQRKPVGPEKNMITRTVTLYYADANNERLVTEKRQITYREGEDKYRVTMEELIKGPKDRDHRANIPAGTRVYGTIRQNSHLIVDLSSHFSRFGGSMAEILGVASVVNTMTQFSGIDKVKILVEGNEYVGPSGQPRGFMSTFPARPEPPRTAGQEPPHTARQVMLYFSNPDATRVVGEKRVVEVPPGTSREEFIRMVLEELIKGPTRPNLHRTIPREARVLSVSIANNTAYVDFSREMHTKHWHGAAGEAMTINSIANTLTEFPYISKVKMTVEGKPMNIEHAVLTEPVGRNESMIAKP